MKRNIQELIFEELRFDLKENIIEIKVSTKNKVEIIYKPDFIIQVSYNIDIDKYLFAIWKNTHEYQICRSAMFFKSFDTIDDLKYFLQTKENYIQQLSNLYEKEKLLIKKMG